MFNNDNVKRTFLWSYEKSFYVQVFQANNIIELLFSLFA